MTVALGRGAIHKSMTIRRTTSQTDPRRTETTTRLRIRMTPGVRVMANGVTAHMVGFRNRGRLRYLVFILSCQDVAILRRLQILSIFWIVEIDEEIARKEFCP